MRSSCEQCCTGEEHLPLLSPALCASQFFFSRVLQWSQHENVPCTWFYLQSSSQARAVVTVIRRSVPIQSGIELTQRRPQNQYQSVRASRRAPLDSSSVKWSSLQCFKREFVNKADLCKTRNGNSFVGQEEGWIVEVKRKLNALNQLKLYQNCK